MAMDQNRPILDLMKEENYIVRPLSGGKPENERNALIFPKEIDIPEHNYGVAASVHENKRVKVQESGSSTAEKLQAFFAIVQKQHPESRLELQHVDGGWKVWCGACKKLLRPDKSGKAIHNIQRQHFASSRHQKKLHLMLQGEEEGETQKKGASSSKGGSEIQYSSKHTDQTS